MAKHNRENFSKLVDKVMENEHLASMRPVVEKELIHFDTLFALDKGGLLKDLVFQGGTAVRLCYGGKRFSEDLDFAGGQDFSSRQLATMKECILDYLTVRYGLDVTVKEPKSLREDPAYSDRKVDIWQISITTAPARPDIPKQRIKLDVASVNAYTASPEPLLRNYDFLPDGYEDILVPTESKSEIMADKLISLPATQTHIRNRDIWDLAYLSQERAQVRADLVTRKITDYQIEDYDAKLDAILNIQLLENGMTTQPRHIEYPKDQIFAVQAEFVPNNSQELTALLEKKPIRDIALAPSLPKHEPKQIIQSDGQWLHLEIFDHASNVHDILTKKAIIDGDYLHIHFPTDTWPVRSEYVSYHKDDMPIAREQFISKFSGELDKILDNKRCITRAELAPDLKSVRPVEVTGLIKANEIMEDTDTSSPGY